MKERPHHNVRRAVHIDLPEAKVVDSDEHGVVLEYTERLVLVDFNWLTPEATEALLQEGLSLAEVEQALEGFHERCSLIRLRKRLSLIPDYDPPRLAQKQAS